MHTHTHPNRVVYFARGGKLESIPADPTQPTRTITVADGDTIFAPATTHNVRNIGDTELVIIETEIKAAP